MSKVINKLLIVVLTSIMVIPCSAKNVINVSYNGEKMQLEQQPQKIEGTVLLPLRSLSKSLGYKVNWNSETKQIDIIEGGTSIRLVIDSDKAEVNGKAVKLNFPAQVIEGMTYVPLRFVGEALNLDVVWDGKTQTVNLEGKYILDEENKTFWNQEIFFAKGLTSIYFVEVAIPIILLRVIGFYHNTCLCHCWNNCSF